MRVRIKKDETPADRAARLTAWATVWMAGLTLLIFIANAGTLWVLKRQLQEMHDGGVDTRHLAEAAQEQSKATERLADNMQTQSAHTKELADEAVVQANASERSAIAAASAAHTAAQDLRPWIQPEVSLIYPPSAFDKGDPPTSLGLGLNIKLTNVGHSPAQEVLVSSVAVTRLPPTPPKWPLIAWEDVVGLEMDRACWGDAWKYDKATPDPDFPRFVFPLQTVEAHTTVTSTIGPGELFKTNKFGYGLRIGLVVCVRYKGTDSRQHHSAVVRSLVVGG